MSDLRSGAEAPGSTTSGRRADERWDLFVTTHTPVLGSGRALRTYGVVRALAANRPVKLLYTRFGAAQPDDAFASIPGVELHGVLPSRGLKRLSTYAMARLKGVPRDFARGVSPELSAAASRLVGDPGCGRAIADGPVAAAALARLARRREVIYNAHNLESAFRHELDAGGGLWGLRPFERKLLSRARESWMVSEADMHMARELCPGARLKLVPNVVDVASIAPVGGHIAGRRAIFVADFSYEPNRNALRFLLGKVMPRVWSAVPDAKLMLVGSGLRLTPDDERVEELGFVEDLAGAYAKASCAVVPLLQGGGTPLKLLEALAYGLPTIATARATSGLDARDGEHCLIANDADGFADALRRVLAGEHPGLGAAGRRLVQERYSIEALAGLLRA